jgi:hypothetical protein
MAHEIRFLQSPKMERNILSLSITKKRQITVLLKETASRDSRPLVVFCQTVPPSPLIHGLKRFRIEIFLFSEVFDYENSQLSILFYCHGVDKFPYGCFLLKIALTAVTTAETLVFRLCDVHKNLALCNIQ